MHVLSSNALVLLCLTRLICSQAHAVNAVVNSWKATLLRSPCGTATCAIMAAAHARGELAIGDPWVQQSIVGSRLVGRLTGQCEVGVFKAVEAELSSRAWITQKCEIILDHSDPFCDGFVVGDLWNECR